MREKTKWLEKYAPPGIDVSTEIAWLIGGNVLATLHSMMFLVHYVTARGELYERRVSGMVLIEGTVIRGFGELTAGVFLSMQVVCIIALLVSVYHYFYHYQGSKMMYLMKRLPDKWEVHKRCLALPIAGSCITFVWMMLLKMIYYAIYILCTPSQCLPL
ncbi:MAG: hypothetical protein IJ455_00435 [Agathobacter sp.]|nr:hypothetical protein [Agathobacter sp.]